MHSYNFLMDLAIILLSTKAFGLLTRKFHMPQVVGALLAGIVLGPAVLDLMGETTFIAQLSEIGVIILMFSAGMEADVNELKKTGGPALVIALLGVIVPLIGGFAIAYFFNKPGILATPEQTNLFLQNIFIGVILTATSVSITVETLKEMGKLNSRAGNAILGAAIIDDILGIIALTVVTSMADTSVNIGIVLLKILGFFIASGAAGFLFYLLFKKWTGGAKKDMRRFVIAAFVFCLLMSYGAEAIFGVADITGAFIAGLIISQTEKTRYVTARFETVSYALLSPVFFASIGLKIILPEMTGSVVLFTGLLAITAIATKIIGCGLGAKICKFTNRESLQVGSGMVSRGEVSLIVASKGAAVGLLSANMMGPVVLVVVIATIISPILLKLVFKSKNESLPPSNIIDEQAEKTFENEQLAIN